MHTVAQARAKAERERRKRDTGERKNPLAKYLFDPVRYIIDQLNWFPWASTPGQPGQVEILQAYELALRQLHERHEWEQGEKHESQLEYWQPGQVIKNWIRIEAGHTVGKTKLAAGIVSHFFDTCTPSIIYTFAPTYPQINDLLWKEIRTDRRQNPDLPGRVLDTPEMKFKGNHFAKGRAASDAHGKGTERTQGQHGKYLLFVLDEAEGIADFVWDAVNSMASGGIAIVLMLANPRTRTSKFYKQRVRGDTVSFRISCLYHPNVLENKEVVPGAVRRDYVNSMIEDHCEIVGVHEEDDHTFELPWQRGVIYKPDAEMMFRVLGIAPANIADNTFVSVGRYEAACKRLPQPTEDERTWARMGVDVARYGNDFGTLYIRWNGKVWRYRQFAKQDTNPYLDAIREAAKWLKAQGVTSLHIRVDAGGGFSSGIADPLKRDDEMHKMFPDLRLIEVHFNGVPHDEKAYYDLVTEMYAESVETVKGIAIVKPPEALSGDLTERKYKWVNKQGRSIKRLTDKQQFKDKEGRSPDDGDGFVMAVAPDFIFTHVPRTGLQIGSAKGWGVK